MSSLVRQEKLTDGIEGADLAHTMALVLAGLPTIRTCTKIEIKNYYIRKNRINKH